MLSNRKIKQILQGYTVAFRLIDKEWVLIKDGVVVDRVPMLGINHIVQAELTFAQRLTK